MAEETKDPVHRLPADDAHRPRHHRASSTCWSRSSRWRWCRSGELGESDTPLTKVVEAGAPDFPIDKVLPFIAMFAVANSALINMLMASRLLYGMATQEVLPPVLGRVHPGPADPVGGDPLHHGDRLRPDLLRQPRAAARRHRAPSVAPRPCCCSGSSRSSTSRCWCCARTPIDRDHFVTPTVLPFIGAVGVLLLLTCRSPAATPIQYTIAGWLLALGVVLWALTWLANRAPASAKKTYLRDPEELAERGLRTAAN